MSATISMSSQRQTFLPKSKSNVDCMNVKTNESPENLFGADLMREIFQLRPNLKIDARKSVQKQAWSSKEDNFSSVGSDSGYESVKGSKKRWYNVDEKLLHQNVKLFIQRYGVGFKNEVEEDRKYIRQQQDKKVFDKIEACVSDNDVGLDNKLIKMLLEPKMSKSSIIINHLMTLCDSVYQFNVIQVSVEREIFKQAGPFNETSNFKFLIITENQEEPIQMKMSKIITLLYRDMNVSAVEKLLIEMTIYCAKQGVLNENFEVNLKQFIEGFRIVAIECINLPSDENSGNLIQATRRLTSAINCVSSRLWTLRSLIETF